MDRCRSACFLAVLTIFAFEPGGARASAGAAPQAKRSAGLYQKGARAYAQGDLDAALAAYREVLKEDPEDPTAELAVGRIEMELAARRAAAARAAAAGDLHRQAADLDSLVLDHLYDWFFFERTLGDAQADLGTLQARSGMVAQFMAERRLALSRAGRFPKERELRALVRRLPTS
ncbi:MAG: hypothetical protein NTY77_07780 [Elusimicrobia bacterium]|nr:hypothetical protein [Elusimicrobiota bacterium]